MIVSCTIPGTPQQQGSKAPWGVDANRNLPSWRSDAITALQDAYNGPPLVGPLEVHAYFVYARPASHYGTGRNAHQLKPSAPAMKHTAPDLDKLQRALGDALTQAGTIRDDARIVVWHAVKRWADIPHTYLTIRHVGAPE